MKLSLRKIKVVLDFLQHHSTLDSCESLSSTKTLVLNTHSFYYRFLNPNNDATGFSCILSLDLRTTGVIGTFLEVCATGMTLQNSDKS